MSDNDQAASRQATEASRPRGWRGESFLRELFLGRVCDELLPAHESRSERAEFRAFYTRLSQFLRAQVDPEVIDETGEYPARVLDGLRELGAFGLKIERKYGGLGFNHREYVEVMQLLGSHCANVTALLSAHQSIGVPQPVASFGSEFLKDKYLPRCARGDISAFALTEPAVGSDPARLATEARKTHDGFVLNGKKLWCTNGTLAELLVVMARDPDTGSINCFVVETQWPGVEVEHRCHFMGLRALGNAVLTFQDVHVPRENLIGADGDGLRIALATLNTGRLSLPAATAGAAKLSLELCRKWSLVRRQWGGPIGTHEAVAHHMATLATATYAMESIAQAVGALADSPERDIRMEAAAAKEWNTSQGWLITDLALQIRGGRGYETAASLAQRGEAAAAVERTLRDSRINRIFEGSSEILHLFIAREAVDKHLEIAGGLIDPALDKRAKLRLLPRVISFYARWYPGLWLSGFWPSGYGRFGALASDMRYVARATRRLALAIFHGMLLHGAKLKRKQAFLFRAVDVGLDLFALTVSILRAHGERLARPEGLTLVRRFSGEVQRRVDDNLRDMWTNEDAERDRLAAQVLAGQLTWLEEGTLGLAYQASDLEPESMEQFFATRAQHRSTPRQAPSTRRAS